MSKQPADDMFFERLAAADVPDPTPAPSRMKSQIFSKLMQSAAETGPLAPLAESEANGRRLCVFEKIVEVSPVGQPLKQINYCRVCHARVLGERVENAPIYWPHCPYVEFQNR